MIKSHSEHCNKGHINCQGREFLSPHGLKFGLKEKGCEDILSEYKELYDSYRFVEGELLTLHAKYSSILLEHDRYKECNPENQKIFDHIIDLGKRYMLANSQVQHQSFMMEKLNNEVDQWKDKVKNMELLYLRHKMECDFVVTPPWEKKESNGIGS